MESSAALAIANAKQFRSYAEIVAPFCRTSAAAKRENTSTLCLLNGRPLQDAHCVLQLARVVFSVDRDTYRRFVHLAHPSLRSEGGADSAARAATC